MDPFKPFMQLQRCGVLSKAGLGVVWCRSLVSGELQCVIVLPARERSTWGEGKHRAVKPRHFCYESASKESLIFIYLFWVELPLGQQSAVPEADSVPCQGPLWDPCCPSSCSRSSPSQGPEQ